MPDAQGIIFVIDAISPTGAETNVAVDHMCSIFRNDLNFSVYFVKDLNCSDVACLLKLLLNISITP